MSALVVSQPDVPFFARASNTIRAIALGALVAMAIGLAALLGSSHDSNECKSGEPPHIEISDAPALLPPVIAQTVSPTFADISNYCPGAVKFTTGDFKFR